LKNREGISFLRWKHGNATTETKGIPCTAMETSGCSIYTRRNWHTRKKKR
jgi:hypothetical protein